MTEEEALEEIKHLPDTMKYSVSYENVLSKFARAQNVLLQSGKTTPLWETHFILVNVLRNKPELSNKVFELSKKYVESRKGTYEADQDLYNFLMRMADADPEHADKVFALAKIAAKSDGQYQMSHDLLATFTCILRRKPEVAENILDIVEDKHALFDTDLLAFSYKLSPLLKEALVSRPDLADRIFNKLPSYSKTDAYTITQFFNDIVTKNPSLANKALDTFNKISPSFNYNNTDFADACFLISKAVQLKPEAAHKAFDVLDNISKKYDNDSLYMGSVHSVLIDIEKASPNLREPCAEMVMNHIHKGVNGHVLYAVFAQACRDKELKEKLINKYPECASILQIASKFSHSTMEEIVYALDFISHDKILKDSNISVCQKCLNVMVGQLDKENGGDGSLGRNRKEFLSSELYKNNGNWLIAAEYSGAAVFGSFFPTYLKKMESANVSVHDAVYFLPMKLSKEDSESLRAFMLKDGNAVRAGSIAERTQQMVPTLDALLMNVFKNDENRKTTAKNDIKKMFSDSLQQNKTKQEFEINLRKYVDKNLAIIFGFEPKKFPLIAITKWYDAKIARPSSELAIICENWPNLTGDDRKKSYHDILKIAKSKKYKDQKYEGFAEEAADSGISGDKYKDLEAMYEASFRTPCPFDVTKEFKAGNLTGRFLPREDPRVGFFGEHTNCCQHFNGIGEACAVSSVIDAWSQLFVVEKENDDGKKVIVAGSWMWENEVPEKNEKSNSKFAFLRKGKKSKIYKYACADNIEAIGDYKSNPLINEIYENMAKYLVNDCGYRKVTVGCGNQDVNVEKYKETDPIPLPDIYGTAYTDAHYQRLLAQNRQAPEVDTTQESLRFVRRACPDDFAQMNAVSIKCFPNGDQDLQMPEDDFNGFVLVDKYKGVVGYVLYDKNEKDIYDMAVIPEYREDKNGSSMKLLGEMIKEVKQLGGEWSCEARENTSLRFLRAMQKRGLCDLEIGKVDHIMSDGTKVYKTKFTPKMPQRQNNRIRIKQSERD